MELCNTCIRSLYFVKYAKSLSNLVFLCFRDCENEILIKLEEIFIKFFKYSYFNNLSSLDYPDLRIFLERELLLGRMPLFGEID